MTYSYDRRAKEDRGEALLESYGLQGLKDGTPVTLYHGSTRLFSTFDMSKSREELVQNYYGAGIFLTPSKRIAGDYAEANRNIGFDPSIIDDLRQKNPGAGTLMRYLYEQGNDGWEAFWKDFDFWTEDPPPGVGKLDNVGFEKFIGGLDGNDIQDVTAYILGSKTKTLDDGDPVNIFNMSTGLPSYIYDLLDTLGLDSKTYRPKIYTVTVTVKNLLITKTKAQARKAKSKGFDSVFYYGPDLVKGVPEVAVFNARDVRIQHVEVI